MEMTTTMPCDCIAGIRKRLARSLIMLGEIGGNDYNYAFIQPRPTNGRYDPISNATRMAESLALALALVPEVVQSITNAAKVCQVTLTA
jgi:hypothetical protein